jgi:signal transduction histidine kinase
MSNDLVQDLFDNIIINAVKYDRNEEFRLEIAHSMVDENKFWQLEFRDNGPGVPDPMKEQIFKRLARGEKSVHGSGLGLTIANEIVTRSGGKIWVEDRVKGDYSQG